VGFLLQSVVLIAFGLCGGGWEAIEVSEEGERLGDTERVGLPGVAVDGAEGGMLRMKPCLTAGCVPLVNGQQASRQTGNAEHIMDKDVACDVRVVEVLDADLHGAAFLGANECAVCDLDDGSGFFNV
jgi:hypothetical protein